MKGFHKNILRYSKTKKIYNKQTKMNLLRILGRSIKRWLYSKLQIKFYHVIVVLILILQRDKTYRMNR